MNNLHNIFSKKVMLLLLSLFSINVMAALPEGELNEMKNRDIFARLKVNDVVTPDTTDLLGERIDLSSGSVSFRHTDISLPGNSALPVEVSRIFRGNGFTFSNKTEFGDWQLDIPNIHYTLIPGSRNNNCSGRLRPAPVHTTNGDVQSYQYWNGDTLNVAGKVNDKLLTGSGTIFKENTEEIITRVTKSNWRISCLDVENASGDVMYEGFLAHAPDGSRYYFDKEKAFFQNANVKEGLRIQHFMLVSRVEDKFGNWVNYTYNNNLNLQSIIANDGRKITFNYEHTDTPNVISAIVVNGRTWSYTYSDNQYKPELEKVTLPDARFWTYELTNFGDLIKPTSNQNEDCRFSGPRTATYSNHITHPNGVTGYYHLKETLHGRSNVNSVRNVESNRMVSACFATMSLVKKELVVPGISNLTWNYRYSQNKGFHTNVTPSSIHKLSTALSIPANIDNLNYKMTEVSAPDASITRYFYNRDFTRYLEGSLLATQYYDTDGATLIKTIEDTYALGASVGNPEMFQDFNYSGHYDNTLHFRYRINKVATKTLLHEGISSDDYITKYRDFNEFGVWQTKEEYFSANKKHFTYQQLIKNTTNWVLNLPTKSYLSSTDLCPDTAQSCTTQLASIAPTSEITYSAVDFTDSASDIHTVLMPAYKKSFTSWLRYYKTYHTTDDVNHQLGKIKRVEFNTPLTYGTGNRYQLFENFHRGQPKKTTIHKHSANSAMFAQRSINNNGWITSTTDFNGNTTQYGYDALGRIQSIKAPSGTGEPNWLDTLFTWSYTSGVATNQPQRTVKHCTLNANKNACSSAALFTTTTTFDGLLRPQLVHTTDGTTDIYQNSTYNAYNKLTFESFASTDSTESSGTHYTFDGLQRQISQRVDNGGTITHEYLSGNKIKVTDAKNNETTTTYLAYGAPSYQQSLKIESPESVTTDMAVNIFGNITSITQSGYHGSTALSQTEYRAYDNQQRLCQVKRNDVGTTVYHHNTIGELLWMAQGQTAASNTVCNTTAASNKKTIYTYDNVGEQRTISYGDGTPTRTFTYDNNGNVTNITSTDFTQSYHYNSLNLLEDESLITDGKTFTLDYGYSTLGHLASLKYPNDTTSVNFAPNAFGLPTQAIKGSDVFVKGGTNKAIYYPNNTINSFTYGNGIKHKTVLNNRKIPSCIVDYKNSQPTCGTGTSGSIVNLKYSYDNNVNITAITNPRDGGIYSLTNLTYDGLDRLKTTTGGYGIGSSTISYDGLGNIRRNKNTSSFDASDLTYSYNSNNRLTGVSGTGSSGYNFNRSDSYDTRGNITHNGKRNFNYNLANQMTNSGSNHYIYDGYNRRIKTTDSKGVSYSMYSQSGKLLYRETPQGGINYIHLGKKLIAKEGTGVVSASDSIMNYKPFGDSIEEPKDGVGYTGHKFDTDLGLSYMQARYYDPVIGRFYSNDPVGFNNVHNFNRYAYANNNPYKYTDPDGNNPKLIADFALNVALNYVTTGQANLLGAAKETISGALNPLKTLKTAKKLAAAISKSSTLKPGKFAKESIPARGKTRSFRKGEREKMNEIGKESGCHTCGSKEAGTKSGNFILDHQPANALTPPGGSQKLYPHCKTCSGKQAGEVTQVKRKLKED